MINTPFKQASLNMSSIEDVTPSDELSFGNATIPGHILDTTSSVSFSVGDKETIHFTKKIALFINVDEDNVIPLEVIQEGYSWFPVYSRNFYK